MQETISVLRLWPNDDGRDVTSDHSPHAERFWFELFKLAKFLSLFRRHLIFCQFVGLVHMVNKYDGLFICFGAYFLPLFLHFFLVQVSSVERVRCTFYFL